VLFCSAPVCKPSARSAVSGETSRRLPLPFLFFSCPPALPHKISRFFLPSFKTFSRPGSAAPMLTPLFCALQLSSPALPQSQLLFYLVKDLREPSGLSVFLVVHRWAFVSPLLGNPPPCLLLDLALIFIFPPKDEKKGFRFRQLRDRFRTAPAFLLRACVRNPVLHSLNPIPSSSQ